MLSCLWTSVEALRGAWVVRKAVWKVRMKARTGVTEGIVLCMCNEALLNVWVVGLCYYVVIRGM